ncbi:MAG: hypothetical protein HXY46_02040 [Syntrophaceae bacterium]|nr:hypothetical protein [Syntrophaceae bacterium]
MNFFRFDRGAYSIPTVQYFRKAMNSLHLSRIPKKEGDFLNAQFCQPPGTFISPLPFRFNPFSGKKYEFRGLIVMPSTFLDLFDGMDENF